MQISPEVLSEKNYTGSRLIEIKNEKVKEMMDMVTEIQKEANPILEEMEKITPSLDPLFSKLRDLEVEKQKTQAELAPLRAPYDELLQKVEKLDQKATLIKNKVQPMIRAELEGQLGEFEIAKQTAIRDGKIFVEVFDEIEEKVKAIRTSKAKK